MGCRRLTVPWECIVHSQTPRGSARGFTLVLEITHPRRAVTNSPFDLLLLSSENVRLDGCSRFRLWCPCCSSDVPQWRAFGYGVLADGVSVDAQLASGRPEGESPELGLLHILPKSPLASGGYSVLLRP